MIRKIILSLFLGLSFTVLYLPYDPFFKKWVSTQFVEIFDNAFDCRLNFKRIHIDLWSPALTFEDMCVTPRDGAGWCWRAQRYSMRCSWWHLITHRSLDLDMGLENFKAESEYSEGALAIEPHVKKMILGKPIIPITLVQLQINDALFEVTQKGAQIGSLAWNASVHEREGALHVALQLIDGSVALGPIAFKKLTASLRGQFCPTQSGFTAQGNALFDTNANAQPYTFSASWLDDRIRLNVSGQDGILLDTAYCLHDQKGDFAVAMLLENIKNIASSAGYNLPELQGKFTAQGAYAFDEKLSVNAAYTCNARAYEKDLSTSGTLILAQDTLHIKGASDAFLYQIDFDTGKKNLVQAHVAHEGKPFITISQIAQQRYALDADLQLACVLLKIDALVKGQLHARVSVHEGHCIVDFDTNNFFALIPHTFYSLQKLAGKADIAYADRAVMLSAVNLGLDQGQIACAHGLIRLDTDYHIDLLSLPLKLTNIPLKVDPAISGLVSGQITIQKDGAKLPLIAGALLVDDASINALEYFNTFGRTQSGHELPFGIGADIKIATRKHAHIKMPLLTGKLVADLHVTNTLTAPTIEGSCALQNGILQLPYKPLYLEKAELIFTKNNPMPLSHVVGLNTIKQHDLMVQMMGPLNKYQLTFSSNPFLEPHEIVALLLTGNPKSTPTTLVPAVANQAVCEYLNYENKNWWHTFFERVRLVPHFDDQSARGGIRAAFEIMVTDQLRAIIQKNFSLTEDTRLQVEYDVSDDIALRATRDERRDLNAEIETRWKF